MIKTLQKKFIATAMAAISILLLVLTGTINVANGLISARQTDEQLKMLAETEKQLMKQRETPTESDDIPKRSFPWPKEKHALRQGLFHPPMNEDMAMSLRFFIVCLNEQNKAIRKDVSRIAAVSTDEAVSYAVRAVNAGKQNGYLEHFKYQILTDAEASENKTVIFLDVSGQFLSIVRVLVLSIIVAAVGWLCMLFFVMRLSKKAIRPIAQNIQKQRQFVTDAGHEIKTPLAIIQANIDAMELINGENKWSRNIRSQTTRLSGLMQNLLTLAKMEEENLVLTMERFSLSMLLEESISLFDEAAALKDIRVERQIGREIFICANEEYIRRLLSILLDNAVKYTSQSGTIRVVLKNADHTAILQVENTCECLPEVDAAKLFDRFYRGDSARTQKNGGYGIGLSAAYAIVKAHQGSISAKYRDGHTIVFTIKI